eukprot:PITA_19047
MSIPRFNNVDVDTLANAASRFTPLRDGFSIEIMYKPVVPDNITNLRVFNDDQQILEFMTNVEVFKEATIEEEEHEKSLQDEQKNWHNALSNALWANRATSKTSINTSLYFLAYGKEAIFPPNLYLLALRLAQELQGTPCPSIQSRINTLVKIEEERSKTKEKFTIHQARIKRWFDRKSTGSHKFDVGDLMLKWDRADEDKGKHTKFQALWVGPFQIAEKIGHNTFKLQTLGG